MCINDKLLLLTSRSIEKKKHKTNIDFSNNFKTCRAPNQESIAVTNLTMHGNKNCFFNLIIKLCCEKKNTLQIVYIFCEVSFQNAGYWMCDRWMTSNAGWVFLCVCIWCILSYIFSLVFWQLRSCKLSSYNCRIIKNCTVWARL